MIDEYYNTISVKIKRAFGGYVYLIRYKRFWAVVAVSDYVSVDELIALLKNPAPPQQDKWEILTEINGFSIWMHCSRSYKDLPPIFEIHTQKVA